MPISVGRVGLRDLVERSIGDHGDRALGVLQQVTERLSRVVSTVQLRTMSPDHEQTAFPARLLEAGRCQAGRAADRCGGVRAGDGLEQGCEMLEPSRFPPFSVGTENLMAKEIGDPLGLEHRGISPGVEQLGRDVVGTSQVCGPPHRTPGGVAVVDTDDDPPSIQRQGWGITT